RKPSHPPRPQPHSKSRSASQSLRPRAGRGSTRQPLRQCASWHICIRLGQERKAGGYNERMERKVFWISFIVLDLIADVVLPLWWALAATIPIVWLSWWIAYRSDW